MASIPNHYKALGVKKYAWQKTIEKKYKARMKALAAKGSAGDEARINANKAIEILTDKDKRKEYDRALKSERKALAALLRARREEVWVARKSGRVEELATAANKAQAAASQEEIHLEKTIKEQEKRQQDVKAEVKSQRERKQETHSAAKNADTKVKEARRATQSASNVLVEAKKTAKRNNKAANIAKQKARQAKKSDKRQASKVTRAASNVDTQEKRQKADNKKAKKKLDKATKRQGKAEDKLRKLETKLKAQTKKYGEAKQKSENFKGQRKTTSREFIANHGDFKVDSTKCQLPNYYKVLGVTEKIAPEQVQEVFKRKMIELQSDSSQKGVEGRVLAVKANEILGGSKKAEYDIALKAERGAIAAIKDESKQTKKFDALTKKVEAAKSKAGSAQRATGRATQNQTTTKEVGVLAVKHAKETHLTEVSKKSEAEAAVTKTAKESIDKQSVAKKSNEQVKSLQDKYDVSKDNAKQAKIVSRRANKDDKKQKKVLRDTISNANQEMKDSKKIISETQKATKKAVSKEHKVTAKAIRKQKPFLRDTKRFEQEMKKVNKHSGSLQKSGGSLAEKEQKRRDDLNAKLKKYQSPQYVTKARQPVKRNEAKPEAPVSDVGVRRKKGP